jgi:transposase-like protein
MAALSRDAMNERIKNVHQFLKRRIKTHNSFHSVAIASIVARVCPILGKKPRRQ